MAKKIRNAKAGNASQGSQRKVIVFVSLLTVMTVTTALLLALAPAPLDPGAVRALFAVGQSESIDAIFDTPVPVQDGRWRYVFIHHSGSDAGNAATLGESAGGLADHFVIGNGDGCGEGEVQVAQRWQRQNPAGKLPGLKSIDPACVSICLIGDFDHGVPTPTQLRRLAQLVTALQARCGIPAANVHMVAGDGVSAAATGVGQYFPQPVVRAQLLP